MGWRRHVYGLDPEAVERAVAERQRSHEEELAALEGELQGVQQRVIEQQRLLTHLQAGVERRQSLCDRLRTARRAVGESAEEVCRALEQGRLGTAREQNRQSAAEKLAWQQSRVEEESRRMQRWLKQVVHITNEIREGEEPLGSTNGAIAAVAPPTRERREDARKVINLDARSPMRSRTAQAVGAEVWRPGNVTLAEREEPGQEPEGSDSPVLLALPRLQTAAAHSEEPLMQPDAVLERLLSGKVAGRDLYAPGGGLLLKRGGPITPEVTARAQREGVLAELVLHMAWPEGSQ